VLGLLGFVAVGLGLVGVASVVCTLSTIYALPLWVGFTGGQVPRVRATCTPLGACRIRVLGASSGFCLVGVGGAVGLLGGWLVFALALFSGAYLAPC
jgi:hypothetical protein